MKVAITSKGMDLEADVDPRFGRCQYFLIVDPDTMNFEGLSNESAMASGGAGPQAAQAISEKGVGAVITGNVGPNAFQALDAAGIKIYIGANGTIRDMIDKFKRGELEEAGGANVGSHSGMGGRR
ncbi:MAG: NifB/NifX family molybdenum-iron cluster-binding protein [Thermoplasmata archaeon]|nr:NifB/NifX family molybdenum-iron cluster-binding protein [Thermoplasmata archaeon]